MSNVADVSHQEQTVDLEFERVPVPAKAQLGFKSFLGQYAGEHCAGTELMIGPLFVAAGVSAFDVIAGLIVGNLLAVLSWMLLCAPIATRMRLTLYYQLEKVCGRKLTVLYNLANGVMFCFLAGSMITVSATAFGIWFNYPQPTLDDIYPSSVGWCIAVVCVGLVVSIVAAGGYRMVAHFANIASPWMVLVFALFGVIGLQQLMADTHHTMSLGELATEVIWKGGDPLPGQVKFTFWHVLFFAWFCNMAMHVGMSDLTVFRFARRSWYSVASAAGMYVGHFMAWLAASILYAVQLHRDPSNTAVLPGPLAYAAAGYAGLACVVIAGWTTANPTIYRAGLAFQAIIPSVSRFKVTLATGLLATAAGLFPGIAMKLLGFVALYGLVLMPIGAVIFIDFWLLHRRRFLGLEGFYAEKRGLDFYAAPAIAWGATLAICLWLVMSGRTEIYFVSLPGWFIASALYLTLSLVFQRGWLARTSIRQGVAGVSWVSLAVMLVAVVMLCTGSMALEDVKGWLTALTLVWFVTTPVWMSRNRGDVEQTQAMSTQG